MCATPTSDGTNGLVATGYVGGEANYDGHDYDDEPMFLIFNGKAFAGASPTRRTTRRRRRPSSG